MPLRRATASVDRLTLEQKVGQMFMLAFAGSTAASAATLLRDHHVGACYLSNDNLVDPAQSATLMAELQGLARAGSGVPALLAADQEGAWAALTRHSCPGPGSIDTHRGLARVDGDRQALGRRELVPFRAAVDCGVDIVMTSHIMFPALDPEHPATLSPVILGDLLRGTMGFGGVILTDSFNMQA